MSSNASAPLPWPDGWGLIERDTVDSTMAEAQRLLPELTQPTWVMARHQTDARGRQGRVWEMPEGNLAATLIYRPQSTLAEAARRSFMAANALFEALALSVDRTRLALKWPNDVLLDGGKVAGILLESSSKGEFVDWLAVGVGVNLAAAPVVDDAVFAPISVAAAGAQVDPLTFLTRLADCFATQEEKLAAFGFPRIREDWMRHAAKVGEEITVKIDGVAQRGIFDTVDQAGNLILITPAGPRSIAAADVYF